MSPPLSMIGMSGPVSSFTGGESGPTFDFLLVGGGGRGGRVPGSSTSATCAGGGGAGGVLVVTNEIISVSQVIYCEVAATGTDDFGPGNSTYLRQDTSSGTVLHYIKGGGKGASEYSSASNDATYTANPFGASGGGGAGWNHNDGASSGSYGNDGGLGGSSQGAGGGGGFGSAGQDRDFFGGAGSGGSGYSLSNFLSSLSGFVAGGGGGGGATYSTQTGYVYENAGSGNAGGGNGGYQGSVGGNATDNTGSGGGGASASYSGTWPNATTSYRTGGNGGSGVIYLKYIADDSLFTYSGTQTVTEYTVSSVTYQIHKITTSGSLTRTS